MRLTLPGGDTAVADFRLLIATHHGVINVAGFELGTAPDSLFARGCNVYVPRAPRHGFVLGEADPGLAAAELVRCADRAMNVVAGLGEEAGVMGLSGGGVLATWLAGRRPDVVTRLVVMSPFYAPAAVSTAAESGPLWDG